MNRKSEHTTRTQIYHLRSGTLFPLIPFPFNQSCSSKNPGPSDAPCPSLTSSVTLSPI